MPTPATLTATVGYGGGLPLVHNGWTQDSGPAATIASPLALTTSVSMTGGVGDYVFRYTVTKAGVPVSDPVTITLKVNEQPVVDAGNHADTFQNVPILIVGTATDDGLPAPASLTTVWSDTRLGGSPDAVFGDVNDLSTTVTFPSQDTYTLTLTANDGALSAFDTDVIISASPSDLGTGYDTATPDAPVSELTDHTWFVDLSHGSVTWWATVNATDGRDIRVTDGNNMPLPFDLIKFAFGSPGTGLLAIKTTATVVPPAFRIWVGNILLTALPATDLFGQYATYDSNYKGFYPDGGGNDRTGNQRNLTMVGAPAVGGTAALSGFSGTAYNGSTQYGHSQDLTNWFTPEPSTVSISLLAKVGAADAEGHMAGLGWSNGFTQDTLKRSVYVRRLVTGGGDNDKIRGIHTSSTNVKRTTTTSTTLADATWGHIVHTGTSGGNAIQLNAGGLDTSSQVDTNGQHDIFSVAYAPRLTGVQDLFTGELSAIGVHNVQRSSDWIAYQNAMLQDQDAFWNTTGGDWTWVAA